MFLKWIRRWVCYLRGHQAPVIVGRRRLKIHGVDEKVMHCFYCDQQWHEPLHNSQP